MRAVSACGSAGGGAHCVGVFLRGFFMDKWCRRVWSVSWGEVVLVREVEVDCGGRIAVSGSMTVADGLDGVPWWAGWRMLPSCSVVVVV